LRFKVGFLNAWIEDFVAGGLEGSAVLQAHPNYYSPAWGRKWRHPESGGRLPASAGRGNNLKAGSGCFSLSTAMKILMVLGVVARELPVTAFSFGTARAELAIPSCVSALLLAAGSQQEAEQRTVLPNGERLRVDA
jgi:hypothetical protein